MRQDLSPGPWPVQPVRRGAVGGRPGVSSATQGALRTGLARRSGGSLVAPPPAAGAAATDSCLPRAAQPLGAALRPHSLLTILAFSYPPVQQGACCAASRMPHPSASAGAAILRAPGDALDKIAELLPLADRCAEVGT